MVENPNQPRAYDAVLGGQDLKPLGGVVLGGLEGVKMRLASGIVEQRVAAISEALKYGSVGLHLVIQALKDSSEQVQQAAYLLLQKQAEPKEEPALREYTNWCAKELLRRYAAGERNFTRIFLSQAKLSQASLSQADLSGASLSGTDLSRASLSRASLSKAYLSGANLGLADLSGASLSGADLSGAYLGLADLSGADLSQANMSGAYLSWASLSGASLSQASLSGADLSGADLSGASLSQASLSGASLSGANYNLTTTFPKGFRPNSAGMTIPEYDDYYLR